MKQDQFYSLQVDLFTLKHLTVFINNIGLSTNF
jgi:hypothetical protein